MTADRSTPPAHTSIFMLINGFYVAGAVSCLAQLGIPDLIDTAPKSADELAAKIGADPQALYRLMRATACVGILSEGPDGKFSQTTTSAILRSDATPSLRAFAIMTGREWHARGWSHLDHCVRTGKQAPEQIYGAHIFEYLKQNPAEGQIFNDAMTQISMIDGPAVADAYNFDGIHSIVDIAGGHGLLLATILEEEFADERHALRSAPRSRRRQKRAAQARDGSLHPCVRRHVFLGAGGRRCLHHETHHPRLARRSLHPDPKSLPQRRESRRQTPVVDNVIHPGNDFSPSKFLDLQMLIFPSGSERTEKQFRALFAASGWQVSRIIPTTAADSIVEGLPA